MELADVLGPILPDSNALNLCLDVYRMYQFIDDIVDEDMIYTMSEKHTEIYTLMFTLLDNKFFRAYEHELKPIIRSNFYDWFASNIMESKCEHLEKSYMLRAGYYRLVAHCCLILHGPSFDFSLVYKLYGETIESLKEEFICQHGQQQYQQPQV